MKTKQISENLDTSDDENNKAIYRAIITNYGNSKKNVERFERFLQEITI